MHLFDLKYTEFQFLGGALGFPLGGLNDWWIAGGMGMGDDVKGGHQLLGSGNPLRQIRYYGGAVWCGGSPSTIGSRLNWTGLASSSLQRGLV